MPSWPPIYLLCQGAHGLGRPSRSWRRTVYSPLAACNNLWPMRLSHEALGSARRLLGSGADGFLSHLRYVRPASCLLGGYAISWFPSSAAVMLACQERSLWQAASRLGIGFLFNATKGGVCSGSMRVVLMAFHAAAGCVEASQLPVLSRRSGWLVARGAFACLISIRYGDWPSALCGEPCRFRSCLERRGADSPSTGSGFHVALLIGAAAFLWVRKAGLAVCPVTWALIALRRCDSRAWRFLSPLLSCSYCRRSSVAAASWPLPSPARAGFDRSAVLALTLVPLDLRFGHALLLPCRSRPTSPWIGIAMQAARHRARTIRRRLFTSGVIDPGSSSIRNLAPGHKMAG